jgi:transcriptional regulator with XRE-family HTH domain
MKNQNQPYPVSLIHPQGETMPGRKYPLPETKEPFRDRLIRFRKAAGLSQKEFAQAVGISPRMAAYYETETHHPPTHLLTVFVKVLGVSADQLLGIQKVKTLKQRDSRLRRLVEEVEQLPVTTRKHVIQYLEHLLAGLKAKNGKS